MLNAVIQVDAKNLAKPLTTVQARFASSLRLKIVHAPQDVSDVFVRLFRAGTDAYFDCPANQDGNADWDCYAIGTCFPTVGDADYEIHGTDAEGNPTSLGAGRLVVAPFSVNGENVPQGTEITVARIVDTEGRYHAVKAVNIGTAEKPDWTWQIGEVIETTDEPNAVSLMPDGLGALHHVRAVDIGYGERAPKTKLVNGKDG